MVFLHHHLPSRKRPSSSSSSPFRPPKIPTTTTTSAATTAAGVSGSGSSAQNPGDASSEGSDSKIEVVVSVLADAGCTLMNPSGPPCLPSDTTQLRRRLSRVLSSDSSLRVEFIHGLSSYIQSPSNFRRALACSKFDGAHGSYARNDSLIRNLLLVPSIQIDLQNMLLEKIPEYFDVDPGGCGSSSSFEDDIARLIINQFRWLDFHVDSTAFTSKLLEVLSICPLNLKKEIIGSLPEMIGGKNIKSVVDSLDQMLQEDPSIVVPVLDSFSNLNLDGHLHDQVITIALSCIRRVDADYMPHLLRFLLLSATPSNIRRIISKIRDQLKFVSVPNARTVQNGKLKGKLVVDNAEASILDALRSSLRFKNTLCEEVLKELKSLERIQDDKVIDIWLLVLIYMNGESLRKSVERIFRKKVIEGCISTVMFDQCLSGNKDLAKDYFPPFLSLAEHLLACKEQKAREFGIHMYICLFEECFDSYSRQEILGALVTHIGSGTNFEVNSALEIMLLLASKYAQELVPLSSHINGILDFLEGFSIENLHKVYEVFSLLSLSAQCSNDSVRSSIMNELLMVVRKQVSNPDIKYKKMGIIGTLKLVYFLGSAGNATSTSLSQKLNSKEAIELLQSSLDSCKQLPLPLVLLYDELCAVLNSRILDPVIMEWIGKHVGDFESSFLSDLDAGQLPSTELYCGLEGELCMNLDGEISPVCLNILPMAASSSESASMLQTLPANFLLMSTMERLANQGSLGGIDALLGCPLFLPSFKYFSGAVWHSLTGKQKETICLCLYYACNWFRELMNAFCTQVVEKSQCTSPALKEEIAGKLLKRLRNLVFLESLLNHALQQYPCSLPELAFHTDQNPLSSSSHPNQRGRMLKKSKHTETNECSSQDNKGKDKKNSKESTNMDANSKLRQPKISDLLKKVGPAGSQNVPAGLPEQDGTMPSAENDNCNSQDQVTVEIVGFSAILESHRSKFRPLSADCYAIMAFSKVDDSCCFDPAAELPLHSYLLHDIHYKIDQFSPPSKQSRCLAASSCPSKINADEILCNTKMLFPSLRRHFDAAVSILKEGSDACQEHWTLQSSLARNPESINITVSNASISSSIFKDTLSFFRKLLSFTESEMNKSSLLDLFEAFQPINRHDNIFSALQRTPPPGSMDYLCLGVCLFLEDILNTVGGFSYSLASEILFTLESLVSFRKFSNDSLGKNRNNDESSSQGLLPTLQKRLTSLAWKLLSHQWDDCETENSWKNQCETVEKILRIYLENSNSIFDVLDELACSILPKVSAGNIPGEDGYHGVPALCSATFLVWCRTLHEENIVILSKLVRDICFSGKLKAGLPGSAEQHLTNLQHCVNVVVSLVNMCRTYHKATLHAMTVKYGGKFVDLFLKVFDFLQSHFGDHREHVVQLVKELQKATRTIQALCSEAKGSKQTAVTSKVPTARRSMERFLFHVKALLHSTSSGCTFWMGNLKHKDLSGQVVSSQAYNDDRDHTETNTEEEPSTIGTEDQEAE